MRTGALPSIAGLLKVFVHNLTEQQNWTTATLYMVRPSLSYFLGEAPWRQEPSVWQPK